MNRVLAILGHLIFLFLKTINPTSSDPMIDIESFNGKFRDELLKREIFDTLYEAQVLIDSWSNSWSQCYN